jgi:hypothetical protein
MGDEQDDKTSLEDLIHARLREVTAELRAAREELEGSLRKPAKRLRIRPAASPAESADRGRPGKKRGERP